MATLAEQLMRPMQGAEVVGDAVGLERYTTTTVTIADHGIKVIVEGKDGRLVDLIVDAVLRVLHETACKGDA